MRRPALNATAGVLFVVLACGCVAKASAQTTTRADTKSAETHSKPAAKSEIPKPTEPSYLWIILGIVVLALFGLALYLAASKPKDPYILRLGPSFFFWLEMLYLGLLLTIAVAYVTNTYDIQRVFLPLVDDMPLAVPWFGALGAVVISLQGVYEQNARWDPSYNYWHIGRPLFGAVLGIVAFFLMMLISTASGMQPSNVPKVQNGRVFYYVLAFLVGYREESFRELMKRAVDLFLRPGEPAPLAPAVSFKVGGTIRPAIDFGQSAANTARRLTVEIQNTGKAPLASPAVTVAPAASTPAGTFVHTNDHVTGGGDLGPGAARTVEVVFTPKAAGSFSGTLAVTASNLSAPKSIQLTGTGT